MNGLRNVLVAVRQRSGEPVEDPRAQVELEGLVPELRRRAALATDDVQVDARYGPRERAVSALESPDGVFGTHKALSGKES